MGRGTFLVVSGTASCFTGHTRLERSGAWWADDMANAVLPIRYIVYGGAFHSAYRHYMKARVTAVSCLVKRHDD